MNRRLLAAFVTILALAALAPPAPAHAGPLDTWHWRSPLPTGNDLHGVAWGNGQYVAVGENGIILTSPHGNTWTPRRANLASPVRPALTDVAWGNGRYVAVGRRCTILVSSDGVTWSSRNIGYGGSLHGVTWCGDRFLAVGRVNSQGTKVSAIFSSPDGESWEAVRLEGEAALRDVACGNGLFVAVGDGGLILTSTDGVAWGAATPVPRRLNGIAFGLGTFVAVGEGGTILTSTDGITWLNHPQDFTDDDWNDRFRGVAFGGGMFVTVSPYRGIYQPAILYSPDGANWNRVYYRQLGDFLGYCSVTWGRDEFVSVGEFGRIDRSPDGITWERRSPGPGRWLYDVAWGGGKFLAVGEAMMQSADGRTWETLGQEPFFEKVTYGAGLFVAGKYDGIYTSPDGNTWTQRIGGSFWDINIEIHAGLFVALVNDGYTPTEMPNYYRGHILLSLDAKTWNEVFIGDWTVKYPMGGSAWGNGVLVVAAGDRVYFSWDALTWFHTGLPVPALSIAFGNGVFVAAGGSGACLSRDGTTWQRILALQSTGAQVGDVMFTHGQFVAVGRDGQDHTPAIFSSPDGLTWARHPISVVGYWQSWAAGPDTIVTVGYGGVILQSGRFTGSE